MRIGELSKHTGVSIRMLRYYEEQGLLEPKRNASGYRDFAQEDVRTIERIQMLSLAGMNLTTIHQFLPCVRGEGLIFEPCDELRKTLKKQILLTNEKLNKIKESKKMLKAFWDEIN